MTSTNKSALNQGDEDEDNSITLTMPGTIGGAKFSFVSANTAPSNSVLVSGATPGATQYSVTGSNGYSGWNWSSNISVDRAGIEVRGDSDIKIGDLSLKQFMERVESRLNLLTPNKRLEAEWDELRELGERYRALEKELEEKTKVWEILKRE
jgi:hypothetical protein